MRFVGFAAWHRIIRGELRHARSGPLASRAVAEWTAVQIDRSRLPRGALGTEQVPRQRGAHSPPATDAATLDEVGRSRRPPSGSRPEPRRRGDGATATRPRTRQARGPAEPTWTGGDSVAADVR